MSDAPKRVKGHKLETISTRGGIMAGCAGCDEVYRPPQLPDAVINGRTIKRPPRQVWGVNDRDKIRAVHQAHLREVAGES